MFGPSSRAVTAIRTGLRPHAELILSALAAKSDISARPQGPSRETGDRGRRRKPALPAAHSPDFNPIEMAFAKLKALLRAAAARTIPNLWQAIADALRRFTPQECANYLAAAG
jgi:hypothetical protein